MIEGVALLVQVLLDGRAPGITDFHPRSHALPKSVYELVAAPSKVYIDLCMQLVDTDERKTASDAASGPTMYETAV